MIKSLSILLILSVIILPSCSKDRIEKDGNKIEDYLKDKGLTAEKTADGVYYIIEVEGTGKRPGATDEVTVDYKGYTLKDKVFDSSYDRGQPLTFALTDVIEGWQLGIPLFKEGGKGTIFIPSALGYGKNPPQGSVIGKNEVLIFDIELYSVN